MAHRIPRGIRNNNPLNIRVGNRFQGEVAHNTDGAFEQFVSMEYGIRAGFVILRRYIVDYELCTIAQIISRWAPNNENNTQSYIRRVCVFAGMERNEPIEFANADIMVSLVDAMIRVECGQRVNQDIIKRAYNMI